MMHAVIGPVHQITVGEGKFNPVKFILRIG